MTTSEANAETHTQLATWVKDFALAHIFGRRCSHATLMGSKSVGTLGSLSPRAKEDVEML